MEEKMTALRKVVNSSEISNMFDLPPSFINRQVEIIVFPTMTDETRKIPKFSMEQIKQWSDSPQILSITGVLKDADLPQDITMKDIKQMRLSEKYNI